MVKREGGGSGGEREGRGLRDESGNGREMKEMGMYGEERRGRERWMFCGCGRGLHGLEGSREEREGALPDVEDEALCMQNIESPGTRGRGWGYRSKLAGRKHIAQDRDTGRCCLLD